MLKKAKPKEYSSLKEKVIQGLRGRLGQRKRPNEKR